MPKEGTSKDWIEEKKVLWRDFEIGRRREGNSLEEEETHKQKENEEEMKEIHRKIIVNLKEGKLKLGTGGGNFTTGGNICHSRGRIKEEENRKEEVGKVTEGSDSAVDNAKLESPNRIDLIDTPNREIEVVLPEGGVKIDQKPEGGESRNLGHFSPENSGLNVPEMACKSDIDPQCPDLEDANVNLIKRKMYQL